MSELGDNVYELEHSYTNEDELTSTNRACNIYIWASLNTKFHEL